MTLTSRSETIDMLGGCEVDWTVDFEDNCGCEKVRNALWCLFKSSSLSREGEKSVAGKRREDMRSGEGWFGGEEEWTEKKEKKREKRNHNRKWACLCLCCYSARSLSAVRMANG